MDKKIAGVLGAVGALASLGSAQATATPDPTEVLKARSFADLLDPIPNAMEKLQAVDEAAGSPDIELAQFYVEHHHHHHHHHSSYYRRRYAPRIVITPGYGYGYYGGYGHHHHHHHHHNSYYRRYREY